MEGKVPRPQHHKKKIIRKDSHAELARQLSQDSLKSPPMAPEHITIKLHSKETGEAVQKKVYVTDVNGVKTLDLYSGWHPEEGQHRLQLEELPTKVCSLITIERLWLSHNRLSSLPPQMCQLIYLRELYLHENTFKALPREICRLPQLEVLWITSNDVTTVPAEVVGLKTLRRLHLDRNKIEEFPTSVCELASLEVLYLNHNLLKAVPDTIGKLRNLRRLYLQDNKISSIPRGMCELTKIKMLYLDNNEITHIKRDFQHYAAQCEANGAVISTKHNPFVTPQAKLKLSLGAMHAPHPRSYSLPHKARRHSDQFERGSEGKQARNSLPEPDLTFRKVESLPRMH